MKNDNGRGYLTSGWLNKRPTLANLVSRWSNSRIYLAAGQINTRVEGMQCHNAYLTISYGVDPNPNPA